VWTQTSGFWSDTLSTPEKEPAILINPDAAIDARLSDSLIAHEATHLVHHRYRPHEENWMREGMALLAEYIVTGYFYPGLSSGFESPETSLVASTDPTLIESAYGDEQGSQYGHMLQFFYYLYRVCGRETLFDTLLTDPSEATGIEFVGHALAQTRKNNAEIASDPACAGFESAFRAFEVARFVADASRPSTYVVAGLGHQGAVRDKPRKLPPYSAMAYELRVGKKPLKACAAGDIPWGDSRCIRVRLK
jgi:hypothetical protein